LQRQLKKNQNEKNTVLVAKPAVLIKNVCDRDLNCDVISEMVQFGTNERNKSVKTDTAKRSLRFLQDILIDKRNNADSVSEF